MSIGRMRERVDIIEVERGHPDGMGGWLTSRNKVMQAWCKAEELNEGRAQQVYNTQVTSPVQFTIRAGTYKLTTDNILRYRDTEYKIHSITMDHMHRYQTVLAYGEG